MDQQPILVYLVAGLADKSHLEELKALFQGDLYKVKVAEVRNFKDARVGEDGKINDYVIRKLLKEAGEVNPEAGTLIVFDYLTSHVSAPKLQSLMRTALKIPHYEVFYLNRYLDLCQMLSPTEGNQNQIYQTLSPNGTDAVLYTPRGRDIILGRETMNNNRPLEIRYNLSRTLREEIHRSNIQAICTSPNVFSLDIVENAGHNADFAKANECASVDLSRDQKYVPPGPGYTIPGFLWFIVITIIIIIVGWCIWRVWPGDQAPEKEKTEAPGVVYTNEYGTGNYPEIANHNGGDHTDWKTE